MRYPTTTNPSDLHKGLDQAILILLTESVGTVTHELFVFRVAGKFRYMQSCHFLAQTVKNQIARIRILCLHKC